MTEDERNSIQNEINILKQLLTNTDYLSHKYADGALTDDEYAETKAKRQAWRDEINEYEAQLEE